MRLPLGAFFFLFQRRLAEAAEPRRLAPGRISVSERPSVSNRANLVRYGSVSRSAAFPRGSRGSLNNVFSGLSSGWLRERENARWAFGRAVKRSLRVRMPRSYEDRIPSLATIG